MENGILDIITREYPLLTKSEKKLADYIFRNSSEVQYLAIYNLADECDVAAATVTRFCKSVGVGGYNQLKIELARTNPETVMDGDEELSTKILPDDSIQVMAKKLYVSEMQSLVKTLDLIKEENISQTVDYLIFANNVYCFGQGGSGIIATEAWARFITASSKFHAVSDNHMQLFTTSTCTANDVILFFSYSGNTRDAIDVLKTAQSRGTKTVLITHFSKSPAAEFADIILLCGNRECALQAGSVATKIGQLFLIDVIYSEFCRREPHITSTNRLLTARALVDKLL